MFSRFRKKNKTAVEDTEQVVVSSVTPKQEAPKEYLKGTKISYHPELIDQFKKDHRELLEIFTDVVTASKDGDMERVPVLLIEFKRRIIGHLLQENVQLYVYLKYLFVDDAANRELAKTMQKEMAAIGKVLFEFIVRFTDENVNYDQAFQQELEGIGAVLVERIKLEEENLYSLYVHPSELT